MQCSEANVLSARGATGFHQGTESLYTDGYASIPDHAATETILWTV